MSEQDAWREIILPTLARLGWAGTEAHPTTDLGSAGTEARPTTDQYA